MPSLQHTIKISGDNKKLKEVMRESDRVLRGSTRVTETYTKLLRNQLDAANKKLDELGKNLKSFDNIKSFKEQARQVQGLRMELEKVTKTGQVMPGGTGGRVAGGMAGGGGLLGMARSIPLIGGLLSVGALGTMAMGAYQQRAQLAGVGLQARALGGRGFRSRGVFGFGGAETTQQALRLVQTIGTEGRGGMEEIQALSRATGVGVEQLIGVAGGQRRAGIGPGQSITAVRKTMSILSDTLGETLDKGRIGEYLQAIDQSTNQLSQQGMIDTDALRKTFAGMMEVEGFRAAPGRATGAISAINQTMKGATGARFGFMSSIMSEALGPGKDTPLNRMFEMGLGLFGRGGELDEGRAGKVFGAIRGRMENMGMGEKAGSLFLSRQFGLDVGTSRDLFRAIMQGNVEKAQKIGDKVKSPEQYRAEALKLMESQDGVMKSIATDIEDLKLSAGENLGTTVAGIYNLLGGTNLTPRQEEEARAMRGRAFTARRATRLSKYAAMGEGVDLNLREAQDIGRISSVKSMFTDEQKTTMRKQLQEEKVDIMSALSRSKELGLSEEKIAELTDIMRLIEGAIKNLKIEVKGPPGTKAKQAGKR